MRIFISYRREDSAGHTGRLFDSLRSHFGEDAVFLDLSDIDAGQIFSDKIQEAIRSADVVLAIIGPVWLSCARDGQRRLDDPADLVRTEIATALERQVPVIPVLIEGAKPPAEPLLPAPLRPLAQRDAHDITDERFQYDVERLIAVLERLAGSKRQAAWPRWTVAAAVLGTVLAIGTATLIYSRSRAASAAAEAPPVVPTVTPAQIAGSWTAAVKYPWGVDATEKFVFTVDLATLSGTASFLGVPRGIVEGVVEGDRIRFETRTTDLDNQRIVHRYTGRLTSDLIELTMQTEGRTTEVPIRFTASRAAGAAPAPGDSR